MKSPIRRKRAMDIETLKESGCWIVKIAVAALLIKIAWNVIVVQRTWVNS